jgi:hypothetical protein
LALATFADLSPSCFRRPQPTRGAARGRHLTAQPKCLMFDALRPRAACLLIPVGLLAAHERAGFE